MFPAFYRKSATGLVQMFPTIPVMCQECPLLGERKQVREGNSLKPNKPLPGETVNGLFLLHAGHLRHRHQPFAVLLHEHIREAVLAAGILSFILAFLRLQPLHHRRIAGHLHR